MSPDEQNHDDDERVGAEDELRRDGGASEAEEQAENHLHGNKLHIVSQVI